MAALLFVLPLFAQQPQTSTNPLQDANTKYTQGVGVGYWPTPGSGLTLNIAAGTVNCAATMTTYAGGTLTMTASMTNYVYLNMASSCAPAVKTTAFTQSDIPIAAVVASGSAITSLTDYRTIFTSLLYGAPVVSETGSTDTLAASYRGNFLNVNGGTTFGLTMPAASGTLAANFPFAIYNGNSGNTTITPTTPNNINALTSQAALTILPEWFDVFYQDSGGTINWHELGGGGLPTYAAFGSTCTTALTWSTSSGIGCASSNIANTTFTTATTAVSANTCNSVVTVTMTGVATSSVFMITPSSDTSGITGWGSTGGLILDAWPTSNTLNYKICNQTGLSITPGAVTFNAGAR